MSKIGIFFGSTTGNTEELASTVAQHFGVAGEDVHNVENADVATMANYNLLLLGSSTWGVGDLQDDWEDFLPKAAKQDLKGKKVALFGCGNSVSNSDTFCNSLATIKEELNQTGCTFVGDYTPTDYEYDETRCLQDGKLIGLLADEDNESEKTPARLATWIEAIKAAL